MSRVPLRCRCGHENWLDIFNLDSRPLNKVVKLYGYECENCESWELVSAETASLNEVIKKFNRTMSTKLFDKAMKKALNLMKKVRNGTSEYSNKTTP